MKTRGKSPRLVMATLQGYEQSPARPHIPAPEGCSPEPGGRLHQIDDRGSVMNTESGLQTHLFFSKKFWMIFVKLPQNGGNDSLPAKFCFGFDFILFTVYIYGFQLFVIKKNCLSMLSDSGLSLLP